MDPTNRPADPTSSGAPPVAGPTPGGDDTAPPVWSLPAAPFPVPPVLPAISASAPNKRRRDPLTFVMVAAAFVALGGVGFAVGRVTAPAPAAAGTGGRGGGAFNLPGGGSFTPGGNGANGLGRFGGGVSVRGTITNTTPSQITIKLANGSTVTIPVDSSTAYHREASASSSDVQTGTTVLVQLTAGGTTGDGGGSHASGAPDASGAPGGPAGRALGTASDVTIVSP
jgi:hypothetical protein